MAFPSPANSAIGAARKPKRTPTRRTSIWTGTRLVLVCQNSLAKSSQRKRKTDGGRHQPFHHWLLSGRFEPSPERFSERDYARFGCYFEKDLPVGESFSVSYRFVIKPGVLTPEELARMRKDFDNPVVVTQK